MVVKISLLMNSLQVPSQHLPPILTGLVRKENAQKGGNKLAISKGQKGRGKQKGHKAAGRENAPLACVPSHRVKLRLWVLLPSPRSTPCILPLLTPY